MSHRPRKRFGQHFLQDMQVIARMVQHLDLQLGDHLVEIGPGQGALTCAILPHVQQVDAIELDRDLIPILQRTCNAFNNLHIHQGDALTLDLASLSQNNSYTESRHTKINKKSNCHPALDAGFRGAQSAPLKKTLRIVGNLPYNISTPLIFHLLQQSDYIQDMHFMLQKEVVDRLTAAPNTSAYGRLSIMAQYHCTATALFEVPPEAFNPPPKVQSAIVRLVPYDTPPHIAQDYALFAEVVKTAFMQRRKTVRNALQSLATEDQLKTADIAPSKRPQEISIAQYVSLSNVLCK